MRQKEIELAVDEFLQLRSEGSLLAIADFVSSYPELQPELQQNLEQLVEIEQSPVNFNNTVRLNALQASENCLSPAEFRASRNGTLSEAAQARIDQHLESCSKCREEYEEQQGVSQNLRGALENAPGDELPIIPNHTYLKRIGKGGQGEVWLARHQQLKELRAVKIIKIKKKSLHLTALEREVNALSKLPKHPSRAVVHDLSKIDQTFVMTMEYIQGIPLNEYTKERQGLDWKTVCEIGLQLTQALQDVHDAGIYHRDIKPGNILFDAKAKRVVLVDFGFAVIQKEVHDRVGTPGYLAPELLTSTSTIATEVFALGATLYYMLTSHAPFDSKNAKLSLYQARAGIKNITQRLPFCPPPLVEAIRLSLDPEPEKRISCSELAELLRQSLSYRLLKSLTQSRQTVSESLSVIAEYAAHGQTELAPLPVLVEKESFIRKSQVKTGDIVRFTAHSSIPGFLTVFNRSEQGKFEVIFPVGQSTDSRITPEAPRNLTLRLAPPAGDEWFLFLWNPIQTEWTHERLENELADFQFESADHLRSIELLDHDVTPYEQQSAASLYLIKHAQEIESESDAPTTRSIRGTTDELPDDDDEQQLSHFESDVIPRTPLAIRLLTPPSLSRKEDLQFEVACHIDFSKVRSEDQHETWRLLCTTTASHREISLKLEPAQVIENSLPVQVAKGARSTPLHCLISRGAVHTPLYQCRIDIAVSREESTQEYQLLPQSMHWESIDAIYAITTEFDKSRISSLLNSELSRLQLTGGFQEINPDKRWEIHLQKEMTRSQLIVIFDSDQLWESPWAVEELYEALRIQMTSQRIIQLYRISDRTMPINNLPANLRRIDQLPAVDLFGEN